MSVLPSPVGTELQQSSGGSGQTMGGIPTQRTAAIGSGGRELGETPAVTETEHDDSKSVTTRASKRAAVESDGHFLSGRT